MLTSAIKMNLPENNAKLAIAPGLIERGYLPETPCYVEKSRASSIYTNCADNWFDVYIDGEFLGTVFQSCIEFD